jgi:oxygen-independent coproporphyrinogen-3 oxidase
VQNEVAIPAYERTIAQGALATARGYRLTGDDRLRAEIIERIMCDFAVDLDSVCTRHGSMVATMLQSAPRLRELIADGIVDVEGSSLAVPADSRFLVRSVAAAFDAHLDRSQRQHSRAV